MDVLDVLEPRAPKATASRSPEATDATLVVDRLLSVLGDFAPDGDPADVTDFKAKLLDYRKGIAKAEPGPDLANVAHACVKTCEGFLDRSRKYVKDREGELMEVISILRSTAATMAGETADFNDQLLLTTDKFNRLSQLDDVRELKRALTAEVATLRTAVETKRLRDEQTYSKLTSRVETLQSRLVKAEEEALIDPLTRIANRGAFDRAIRKALAASQSSGVPMTLAMVDIDHFKSINDRHGHPIGDRVLVCTAQWLGKVVRHTDLVARYGGEEFVVIMNDAKIQQVEARLTKALGELSADSFEYESGDEKHTIKFTASVGITEAAAGDAPSDIVKRADEALYDAKRKGRNRVVAKKRSMLANLLARPK
jgi:diguanylate cyclase